MIAIDIILQSIQRIGPVSAYFAYETIEVPKLAFGDEPGFRCMKAIYMVLNSLIKSECASAKFMYKII